MSTAVRAGTDRDAFTRAAAGQAMDDPTGRPEIAHGGKPPTASARRPHIVIIGAGFGGLSAATGLGRAAAVTVIDQRNHHLFRPLLYQVATAALLPADIAAPIRGILSRQANTEVILGTVTGIDVAGRAVLIGERRIPYDQLVIATGARESYFGHDKWAAVTSGLKTIEDATTMRRRILIAFERAEACLDEIERRGQLTFVIIGGGPTGVELAGALAELAKAALACDFRHIDPTTARIVLIEAGRRLLPGFSASLSEAAARALARLGVEVRLGAKVTSCGVDGAMLGDEQITSRTVIWAAGVAASPAAGWLGIEPGRGGRVPVGPDLTLPGHPEIFVIGDTAQVTGPRGPLPGVAPVAKQQGAYVARVIAARLAGKPPPGPFRYRDQSRHDRPQRRSGRFRLVAPDRPPRVAGLGCGAHLLPDRLPQPHGGGDRLAVVVPDLSARRPADHRARQCDRRDLYRIEAITDRNFRFPMGATVVNGDTAASGAVSAKGNHPMNRNLFFDPIALRANAVPATVES
jgi:NADH:ubiquinone reductase (H+-translocating)